MINIMQKEEFRKRMYEAACQIQDILATHCGPFAGNAMWQGNTEGGKILDLVFSNDGISIVDNLTSDDPIEKHLIGFLRYIGASVDSETHDNTTTSMLLACSIIKYAYMGADNNETPERILRGLKEDLVGYLEANIVKYNDTPLLNEKLAPELGLTPVQVADAISEAMKDFIVTNVALTSSKGDMYLAEQIRELFMKSDFGCMPEHWELNYGEQEKHGGTTYDVKVPDYQFRSPYTRGSTVPFLTEQEEHHFKVKDALCLITNDVMAGELIGAQLQSFFDDLHHTLLPENYEVEEEGVKSLKEPKYKTVEDVYDAYLPKVEIPETVFIICGQGHRNFIPKLKEINKALKRDKRNQRYILIDIASEELSSKNPIRKGTMRLESLVELGRWKSVHTRDHGAALVCVPGVTVTLKATEFELDNLYSKSTSYTPYYDVSQSKKGTLLESYEQRLEELKLNPAMLDTVQLYLKKELEYNIQLLKVGPQPSIRVEGLTHDVRHKIHVIQDVYGSVYTALKSGVIIGGIPKLAQIESQDLTFTSSTVKHVLNDVMRATYQADGLVPTCQNSPLSYVHVSRDDDTHEIRYDSVDDDVIIDLIFKLHHENETAIDHASPYGIIPMVAADGLLKSVERITELLTPFLKVESFIDKSTPIEKG